MNVTATAHEAWDQSWQTQEGRSRWLTAEPAVLTQATRLRLQGAQKALDLGCGVGRHALALARLGFETTAFDASAAGLEQTRESASNLGLSVKTTQGVMTELPFEEGEFDYLLSWNVIYHGDGSVVRSSLGEIARVLKPGGIFQATMLSKRRFDYGVGVEISPNTFVQPEGTGDKTHPHFFCDATELTILFHDFDILSLEDVDDENNQKWHWNVVAERKV